MKYLGIVGLTFFVLFHFPFATHEVCSFDSNDWFDECPDQNCGAPPAGGQGGGGGGGGPIIVSYDLGPLFSLQEDWDADGVVDTRDNCPFTPNDQMNADGDDFGDLCDNCPDAANNAQANTDYDIEVSNALEEGVESVLGENILGDACDPDIDGDDFVNEEDNCAYVYNALQEDYDGDGIGDLCDEDDDNDGIPDSIDNCSKVYNPDQENDDSYMVDDTAGNACDEDWDNDGFAENNGEDLCPKCHTYENNDYDGDGVGDACDNCPNVSNSDQTDSDQDGRGDECDT